MSLEILKNLKTLMFVLAGLEVVCLGGSIYTAVQKHHYEVANTPITIATPASIPVPANPGQNVPQFH